MLQKQWAGLVWPASEDAVRNPETGVNQETLVKVGKASVDVPEDFVSRVPMIQASVIEDPVRKYTPDFRGMSNLDFKVWKVGRIWIGLQPRCVLFLGSE